jgi:membrane protein
VIATPAPSWGTAVRVGRRGDDMGQPPKHSWRKLIADTISNWNDHDATTQSAALAFFTLFSLAPVLIVVIAVAGAVFGADRVRDQIFQEFQLWMGPQAASFVEQILRSAAQPTGSRLAAGLGIVTLIFGASGAFVQLQASLNRVWEVKPKPGAAFTTLLRKRLLSFAVILGIGFLLVVSLVLSAALSALGEYVERHYAVPAKLLHLTNIVVSFVVITLLFALIYRLLPDVRLEWRDVAFGSLVTSALFAIGKELIGLYLGRAGVASAYGAAGSLVMLLLWVYYSALIFLLGAELTRIQSLYRRGRRPPPEAGAERAAPEPPAAERASAL